MVKRKVQKFQEEDSALLDPSGRSFVYDEVDDFNDGDSEDDYYGSGPKFITDHNPKEQVLGLGSLSSEEDEDDDDDDDDEEEEEEEGKSDDDDFNLNDDDIQSAEEDDDKTDEAYKMSFGKRKSDYFGTDITDQRIHNAARKKGKKANEDIEALQFEIDGASGVLKDTLQERCMNNFLSCFHQEERAQEEEDKLQEKLSEIELGGSTLTETKIKSKKGSKKTKSISLLNSELDADLIEKAQYLTSTLMPLIEALKKGLLPKSTVTDYLHTSYFLSLNYLNTVVAYKMLLNSDSDMNEHPIETRLTQFRHMFKEMDLCKSKLQSEVDSMMADLTSGKLKKSNRKMLSIMKEKALDKKTQQRSDKKKVAFLEPLSNSLDGNEEMMDVEKERLEDDEDAGDDRRLITYQISKNKGLLPSRKKEQRNPRVKYKKKYQNKLKRRKGQVREVRKEIYKYSGEISGIKTNLVKSIKLK